MSVCNNESRLLCNLVDKKKQSSASHSVTEKVHVGKLPFTTTSVHETEYKLPLPIPNPVSIHRRMQSEISIHLPAGNICTDSSTCMSIISVEYMFEVQKLEF